MKTVKVWVPQMVWVEKPVTTVRRVCEQRPVTCKVTVYRTERREQTVQVTHWRCVPEERTQTYTVMNVRSVPYQATRTVKVCVPQTETVTLTRMVPRTVQKQVPVEVCSAPTSCDSSCDTSCGGGRHGRGRNRCAGLGLRHRSCCD
jgi:hypothetical protein